MADMSGNRDIFAPLHKKLRQGLGRIPGTLIRFDLARAQIGFTKHVQRRRVQSYNCGRHPLLGGQVA